MRRRAGILRLGGGICLACVLALSAAACGDETIMYPPLGTYDAAADADVGTAGATVDADATADGRTPVDGGGDEPGADADGGSLTSLYSNAAGCSCTIVEL
jgi:hypothetical protein